MREEFSRIVVDFNIFMNLIFSPQGGSRKVFDFLVLSEIEIYTPFFINEELGKYLAKIKNKTSKNLLEEVVMYFF